MVILMFNDELFGLLMIIIEYLMILLILMKLIVVNSVHREYLEMNGFHMVVLPCDVMYAVMDVLILSALHMTIVAISHLVKKVPSQELLSATEVNVRLVR